MDEKRYSAGIWWGVNRLVAVFLVGFLVGCGDDPSEPNPDAFTEEAAREAYRSFLTAESAGEYCSFLTKRAEAQIVAPLVRESFPDAESCPEGVNAIAESDPQFELGQPLSAEARKELRQPARLDPETHTAAFLSETREGIVLRLVDGQWKVAGIATGG